MGADDEHRLRVATHMAVADNTTATRSTKAAATAERRSRSDRDSGGRDMRAVLAGAVSPLQPPPRRPLPPLLRGQQRARLQQPQLGPRSSHLSLWGAACGGGGSVVDEKSLMPESLVHPEARQHPPLQNWRQRP